MDTNRPERLNPFDHPVRYRVASLCLTAGSVRQTMRRDHRRDASNPAPVGPCSPSKVWQSRACPYAYSTVYEYFTPDGLRAAECVDPEALLELMGLPIAWADPDAKPAVPEGHPAADELLAILRVWFDPETRRVPRKNKRGADSEATAD